MSEATCALEAAVINAARSGAWSADLREHAHECAACGESARVTAWLADVAARLGRRQPAPDPTYVWLRAEIEKRARQEQASIRRRSVVTAMAALAAAGGGTSAMVAALPQIAVSLRAALPTALTNLPLVDVALMSSGWLGLIAVLAGTYLLVLRPLR